MTWVIFAVAFLIGVALVFVGGLYAMDPEGRGAGMAMLLGGIGSLLVVGAVLAALVRGVWLLAGRP